MRAENTVRASDCGPISKSTIPKMDSARAIIHHLRRSPIPVLFFFSGLHGDYHKPSDTWDKINGPSAKVVSLIYDVASSLVASDTRPKFQ